MSNIAEVYYPPSAGVGIWALQPGQLTDGLAHAALAIMTSAYEHQFEGPHTVTNLPHGAVKGHFRPDDSASIRAQRERMALSMEGGSTYWFAVVHGLGTKAVQGLNPIGLAKTSPSRPRHWRHQAAEEPNLYLNDIAVFPAMQLQGVATSLVHAATKYSDHDPGAHLVLDNIVGSPAGPWFRQLGLRPRRLTRVAPFEIGDQSIPQVRMQTRGGHLGGFIVGLEDRYPRLTTNISIVVSRSESMPLEKG